MEKEQIKEELIKQYKKKYNKEPEKFFFAPGRVNFIGEHIDYNGGKVLPFAIDKGIYAAVGYTNSDNILLSSQINNKIYELNQSQDFNTYKNSNEWVRYPIGILQALKNQGFNLPKISIFFWSDLPIGSGLSSSAAIEILTAYIFLFLIKQNESLIDRIQMSIMCQQVENQFIGVQCGIMDQFSIAMGKKNHFILLDTRSLEYEYLNFDFSDVSIIVINSNKQRELSNSKYNQRRLECTKSLEILKKKYNIRNLVDATEEMLNELSDDILKKRVRHVIEENNRVKKIQHYLTKKRNTKMEEQILLQEIGTLLLDSHTSLRDNYEVSCKELDFIVEESIKFEGVYGSRMTGAGFGGCAITLIKKEYVNNYIESLKIKYKKEIGIQPDIFPVEIEDGVHAI